MSEPVGIPGAERRVKESRENNVQSPPAWGSSPSVPRSPSSVVEMARDLAESLVGFWRSEKASPARDSSALQDVWGGGYNAWERRSSFRLKERRRASGELLLSLLADELLIQVFSHLDVRQTLSTAAKSCHRLRRLGRC